jgi:hypothetical protein
MYEFCILDSVIALAYKRLTFPMFRSQLSATHGSFTIVVQYQSQPCGLVLAEYLVQYARWLNSFVEADRIERTATGEIVLGRSHQ